MCVCVCMCVWCKYIYSCRSPFEECGRCESGTSSWRGGWIHRRWVHILIYSPIYRYVPIYSDIYRLDEGVEHTDDGSIYRDIVRYIPIFTDKYRYIGHPKTGGLDGWSAIFFVSFIVFVGWTLLQVLFFCFFILIVGWTLCNCILTIYVGIYVPIYTEMQVCMYRYVI